MVLAPGCFLSLETCSSYKCAVTQHQCTAALLRAKCTPQQCILNCFVLLGKTSSQHACFTADTAVKICSSYRCAMSQHQRSAALPKRKAHFQLSCAAGHNRLTACLCNCYYIYEALLFIHVCSDPTPMLSSTAQGKVHSQLSNAAGLSRLTCCIASTPWKICSSYRCAAQT